MLNPSGAEVGKKRPPTPQKLEEKVNYRHFIIFLDKTIFWFNVGSIQSTLSIFTRREGGGRDAYFCLLHPVIPPETPCIQAANKNRFYFLEKNVKVLNFFFWAL